MRATRSSSFELDVCSEASVHRENALRIPNVQSQSVKRRNVRESYPLRRCYGFQRAKREREAEEERMRGVGSLLTDRQFMCCHAESWCGFGAHSAPTCRIFATLSC